MKKLLKITENAMLPKITEKWIEINLHISTTWRDIVTFAASGDFAETNRGLEKWGNG